MAEGYAPASITLPDGFGVAELDGRVLSLDPTRERWVRLRMGDGAPLNLKVNVASEQYGVWLLGQSGSEEGLYGPIDWLSGDLLVEAGPHKWTLRAAELEQQEVVERSVRVVSGELRVTGIPRPELAAQLIAKSGLGLTSGLFHPSGTVGDTCLFNGLPPGGYVVGPTEWVRAAMMHSLVSTDSIGADPKSRSKKVRVRPGETTTVEWNPNWTALERVSGRVTVSGPGRGGALLIPIYVDTPAELGQIEGASVNLILSNRTRQLRWADSGEYAIEVGDPRPFGIAVCLRKGEWFGSLQGFYLERVIAPGESAVVETTTLELEWRGEQPENEVLVHLELDEPAGSGLFHAMDHLRGTQRRWRPNHPLRFEGIPVRDATVNVGGVKYRVEMQGGFEHQVLRVGPGVVEDSRDH